MAAATSTAEKVTLVGMCNPLLDISAVVPLEIFEKYKMKVGDAVLAAEEHMPVYADLVDNYKVDYIAGGAGQNSIRVAEWMLKEKKGMTAYFGAVGDDKYAEQMKEQALKDGVNVQYMVTDQPTGTCAVLITPTGGERSLIANLSAANHFKVSHLETETPKAIINDASIFYITGFFLTVSCESIDLIGKHCVENHKTLCMNLSAPFLIQFFGDQMHAAIPYVDFMFGNELESLAFGEKMGWGNDIPTIAQKIAALPKASGFRPRTVVITQGPDKTIVVHNGKMTKYDVHWLPKEEIVDTNGAGDAFVGGFLSQLVHDAPIEKCIDAAHWAARVIIKRSGCAFPDECDYN
jgi:adenosine kinase